ncbi:inorganic phosphate transporter [Paracoccus fistulariae]|uniref:Phosphate transporter n=1 Tax=Paracoccus fistulariae TaxID=658446 RepID=A0ABY7SHN2_9RHOB|nr:inorganic phosphate transporter [Paracoccus fistulariae]MDB6181127.1 inorganic phosphate transporter [Paracoccus fistulariae]WCR06415.1 inorganic phosphate transporter [Paracoccus fistulariae]
MVSRQRSYHTLDKDLGRITHTEVAQAHAFRPVRWLGLAVLAVVVLLILVIPLTGHEMRYTALGAGLVVAAWLGISIGSNDVANSLGPAVGAGAIGMLPGLLLVGAAQIAGASLAGGVVTERLASGIFDPALLASGVRAQFVMLSALLAAAVWITMATGIGLPVSTSHSIVGGIAGAGLAALGAGAIHWDTLSLIAVTWVITPFVSGALAGAILIFLRLRVLEAEDRARAARRWLPLMVGLMTGAFAAYLALLARSHLHGAAAFPLVALAALLGGWFTLIRLREELDEDASKVSTKKILRPALVISAVMLGFAHGANDVANVAGPFSVILGNATPDAPATVPLIALLGAGSAIALGTVLFGRRLVRMVGSGITRLNPGRAFCVSLATAGTVLLTTWFGLPVSTTHVAIGGIFGVGFTREWLDRRRAKQRAALPADETRRRILIRRSHVVTITTAWLVTVPATALIGMAICLGILGLTGV